MAARKDCPPGADYSELAHLFKDLGCTDAINLDGGGSTTFWLDGKVMNSPSDKHERSAANPASFIVEHNPPPPPPKWRRRLRLWRQLIVLSGGKLVGGPNRI